MAITSREIAQLVDGELLGDPDRGINSVASPSDAKADQIAFIANESGAKLAASSNAGCLIVPRGSNFNFAGPQIRVDSPKTAFARVGAALHPRVQRPSGVHSSALVAEDAELGDRVFVGAFSSIGSGSVIGAGSQILEGVRIGDGVTLGEDCTIHPNTVIEEGCRIGSRVVVKAGAVIGSKGFGFVRDGSHLLKFPQVGTVVIEDDVEIGAGTCVDRGALGETWIGSGTKLDNLVQVAHNVTIGKRCVVAALTGISGSAVIGDDCVVGGQVGFADHVEIESGAVIGAKSAVFPGKRVRKGVWAGIPVMPLADYKRLNAHIRSLPKLRERIRALEDLMDRLERSIRNGRD